MVELIKDATPLQVGDKALVNRDGQPAMVVLGDGATKDVSGVAVSGQYEDLLNPPEFASRQDAVDAIASGFTREDGKIFSAGSFFYRFDSTAGNPIADMPGVVPNGDVHFEHFGIFGSDRGTATEPNVPAVDESDAIQAAFDYALVNGRNCSGNVAKVYGVSKTVIWGRRSGVANIFDDLILSNARFVALAGSWSSGDQSAPDLMDWTFGNPVLLVGRSGSPSGNATSKYRISARNIEVDCRRIAAGGIHFRAATRASSSDIFVTRGTEYQIMIGENTDSASCTDSEFVDLKMREWFFTSGPAPGNGHYDPDLRTSYGFVVRSNDIKCINVVSSIAKNSILCVYGFNNQYIGGSFWASQDRQPGRVLGQIWGNHRRYRFLGTRFDDARLNVYSFDGQMIGCKFIQYDHGNMRLIATEPNTTGERFIFIGNNITSGNIGLETEGSGTWDVFKGVCVGNNNNDGKPVTIQGLGDRRIEQSPQLCPDIDRFDLYSGAYFISTSSTSGTLPPGTSSSRSILNIEWASSTGILQQAWVHTSSGGYTSYVRRGHATNETWSQWLPEGFGRIESPAPHIVDIDRFDTPSGPWRFSSSTSGTLPPGTSATFCTVDVDWASSTIITQTANLILSNGRIEKWHRRTINSLTDWGEWTVILDGQNGADYLGLTTESTPPHTVLVAFVEPWLDPSENLLLSWVSTSEDATVAEYRVPGASSWQSVSSQRSRPFPALTGIYIHTAVIKGLNFATVYECRWPGSELIEKFRASARVNPKIAMLSDFQSGNFDSNAPMAILGQDITSRGIDILAIPGDHVSDDGRVTETYSTRWLNYLTLISTNIRRNGAMIPMFLLIGNHEGSNSSGHSNAGSGGDGILGQIADIMSWSYWDQHPTRFCNSAAWFAVGDDLMVITLETDHTEPILPQLDWVGETLVARSVGYKRILLMGHAPAFYPGPAFTSSDRHLQTARILRNVMYPMLEAYADKIICYGCAHAHVLAETPALRVLYDDTLTDEQNDERYTEDAALGIVQLGTGPCQASPRRATRGDDVSGFDGTRMFKAAMGVLDGNLDIYGTGITNATEDNINHYWMLDLSGGDFVATAYGTHGLPYLTHNVGA
jgi:hypothetical protein